MKKKWVCGILIALSICLVALMIFAYHTGKYGKANTLIAAIRAEDQEKVERLLQSGVDPNQTDLPISNYWTFFEFTATRPLTVACSTKNLEIVKLLIEYGATAETIEYTGNPLREMIFYYYDDSVEIVKLLLENGADPNYEEYGYHIVFEVAEMYPMLHGEDFLTGYDETVAEGITQIVQMVSKDISIDLQSPLGNTVLMCAAKRGNMALIEYCIAQGCNVDITNKDGQTAYEIAVEANKHQAAERIKVAKTEAGAVS